MRKNSIITVMVFSLAFVLFFMIGYGVLPLFYKQTEYETRLEKADESFHSWMEINDSYEIVSKDCTYDPDSKTMFFTYAFNAVYYKDGELIEYSNTMLFESELEYHSEIMDTYMINDLDIFTDVANRYYSSLESDITCETVEYVDEGSANE